MNRIVCEVIYKYDKLSLPVKAAFWFTVCSVMLKGVAFFTTPLFTRLLSTEEYGILSIYLSYQQIILIFATWELPLGTYQKGLFKYKNEKELLTSSAILFVNILTLIVFITISILWNFFSSFTGLTYLSTFVLLIYLIVQPAYSCWMIGKRIIYDYKPIVITSLLFSISSVLLPIFAMNIIRKTAEIKYVFSLIPNIL